MKRSYVRHKIVFFTSGKACFLCSQTGAAETVLNLLISVRLFPSDICFDQQYYLLSSDKRFPKLSPIIDDVFKLVVGLNALNFHTNYSCIYVDLPVFSLSGFESPERQTQRTHTVP
jgi:hypothetical protein